MSESLMLFDCTSLLPASSLIQFSIIDEYDVTLCAWQSEAFPLVCLCQ
ncbi:hypothetical protein [Arsenophonus apicola]|uniref:Uncharacterized protein n=1 Tax=Arsenophonus apicola TaxID=2879119 RepID=A0ABY8P3X4_9GAMM|nr:hypothetical protein [Arsenophonus apicola]WGO84195.1 hypothetical protein QG404_04690 [Arsenophonus apicola]